jgi:hypothetical protein
LFCGREFWHGLAEAVGRRELRHELVL